MTAPSDRAISGRIVTSGTQVRDYLVNAYLVDHSEIDEAMSEPDSIRELYEAIKVRSFACYPGDRIAQAHGWAEDPDYNSDDEENEELDV
jgi:hypothetical protein